MQRLDRKAGLRQFIPPAVFRWRDFNDIPLHMGAVLFIDVAGFTTLSELLAAQGAEGAELLERYITSYLDALLDEIEHYYGLPVKISGDALTVLFPETGSNPREAILRALACATTLSFAGHDVARVALKNRVFILNHKIGVGYGPIVHGRVGDARIRAEYVFGGKALEDAVDAEHLAYAGQVWASPVVVGLLNETTWWSDTSPDGFCRTQIPPPMELRYLEPQPPDHFIQNVDDDAVLEQHLITIPTTVREHAQQSALNYLCRHQRVSVLFAGCPDLRLNAPKDLVTLDAHYRQVQQITQQFGGFLSEHETGNQGSKLIVLFGAPSPLEDPVGQASRCALALQVAARELALIQDQRIGLATGRLYVGRIGCRELVKYSALGDRMNLAARLMEVAERWAVLAESQSVNLCDGSLTWGQPTKRPIRGKNETIEVYPLIARMGNHRNERRGRGQIGRHVERQICGQVLDGLQRGHGSLLHIEGGSGVGKTRMLDAIRRLALDRGISHIPAWSGNAGVSARPLAAWKPFLLDLIGATSRQTSNTISRYFKRWLHTLPSDTRNRAGRLADILEISWTTDPVLDRLSMDRQIALRRNALVAAIRDSLTEGPPMVFLLDDCERLDHSSIAVLRDLAPALARMPLMIALTGKELHNLTVSPEGAEALAHARRLILLPLDRSEVARLATHRLKVQQLNEELANFIHAKAQGVPLLVEAWLDVLRDHGQIQVIDDIAYLTDVHQLEKLPNRLEAIILTQLERLSPDAQLTVWVASVVGQSMTPEEVAALHPERATLEQVRTHLKLAAEADLIRHDRQRAPRLYFNRPEVREAIHDSMPFHLRRTLHARRVEHLEQTDSQDLHEDDVALRLAAHHEYIADPEAQSRHFGRALEICQSHLDHTGAVRWALKLLEATEKCGDPAALLQALYKLVQVYSAIGENEARRKIIERWLICAAATEDFTSLLNAHLAAARAKLQAGDVSQSLTHIESALALSRQLDEPGALIETLLCAANVHGEVGNLPAAVAMSQEAATYLEDASPLQTFKIHFRVGFTLFQAGQANAAYQSYLRALHHSEVLGDLANKALLMGHIAKALMAMGQPEEGHAGLLEALELKRTFGNRREIGVGLCDVGCAYRQLGDLENARIATEEALHTCMRIGYFRGEVIAQLNLGEILWLAGNLREASEYFERAGTQLRRHPHEPLKTELNLRQGELALTLQDWISAQSCFEAALKSARKLGRVGFECAGYEGLAQVSRFTGELALARSLSDRAIRLASKTPESISNLPRLWWRAAQIAEAEKDYAEADAQRRTALNLYRKECMQLTSPTTRRQFSEGVPWHREMSQYISEHCQTEYEAQEASEPEFTSQTQTEALAASM